MPLLNPQHNAKATAMNKRFPNVLFFINGPVPADKEIDAANKIQGANVSFRNARMVPEAEYNKKGELLNGGSIEVCDGTAGNVPKLYGTLPTAENAIKTFEKAERAKRGFTDPNDPEIDETEGAIDRRNPGIVPGTAGRGADGVPFDAAAEAARKAAKTAGKLETAARMRGDKPDAAAPAAPSGSTPAPVKDPFTEPAANNGGGWAAPPAAK